MQPSLLDRHRAEEAQSVCTKQSLILTAFVSTAGVLFLVSNFSTPPPVQRIQSADLARSAMRHRALTALHDIVPPPPNPPSHASPPPPPLPPPPLPAAHPAGVADATCHARLHTDYMGERAPVWGLGNPGFHLKDAGECCAACQAHAAVCSQPNAHSKAWWPARPELRCGNNPGCNIWVFCPEKQCFAFDIHARAQGSNPGGPALWLKPHDP